MTSLQNYISIIRPEKNDTFVAYVPAIPSCHALGRTQEEAMQNLKGVFKMIQAEYEEEGRIMPEEVQLFVIPKSYKTSMTSM